MTQVQQEPGSIPLSSVSTRVSIRRVRFSRVSRCERRATMTSRSANARNTVAVPVSTRTLPLMRAMSRAYRAYNSLSPNVQTNPPPGFR